MLTDINTQHSRSHFCVSVHICVCYFEWSLFFLELSALEQNFLFGVDSDYFVFLSRILKCRLEKTDHTANYFPGF